MLSAEQIKAYKQQGFLVLHEHFSLDEMQQLRAEALNIVDNFDPNLSRSIFSTESESNTNRDDYFLSSDDKVRCFFEEDAFSESGELGQEKALSINKIGHALHRLNPVFSNFSQGSDIANIARDLGLRQPEIRQSMYIFKQPKIGGVIRWHQDATYFYTTPQTVITYWLAIEDATLINGCLQVDKQGAHFPLKEQFKRYENDSTELVQIEDIEWPENDRALPLEVKAGTLVVFNGVLPHFSEANRSNKSRHAFTLHLTCRSAEYHTHNWIRAEGLAI
ncbi:phytanoyl-CoA dioxygenase family protein [Glaciecola sp. MH2013]|uniref:phytanoyl-CoA dioxygenase family protein n=1 Tax=Glaciecola sp. MH2013 TaxID=2785524 RepID=UPI00189FE847|nr:phytanoyl-CoA dioxygenase family protein [Glaciecola sp. MH2013]MBF7073448.1 phytanoyl-CoA dioxygenase family protein [Glaciecola sp. MH2013]